MPAAGTVAELQVVIGADTSGAESKLSSFGSSFGAVIGTGVAAAGAAVAAGVAVGVKAAGDLEQAVANISTIKPEIDTSAVFAALNEMSTRIPQTAAQLGESLYNVFSSVDVSASEGLALVEKFAQGAVGAGTSAETFGTAAMGVMNAYGLSVKDADHISDVFFNTVNKGVITGQELAASLGPVTQSAKAAGVGLDELGAMIAAVTKEGGPAAQNVNNLNNFLQKITTKEAQKQLNELGVATKTATGEFRPTADVLTDLKARLAGMTEAARANALQAIFPDAQARQGAQTLLSQLDLVKSATAENAASSGAAASAYEKMSATFNSQSKLLVNNLMAILTTVGAMLLPAITPLVKAFAESLPGAFQAAQAALAPFAQALMSTVVPAFNAVMAALPTVIGLLQNLFDIFTGGDSFDAAAEVLDQMFGPAASDMIMNFVAVAGEAVRAFAAFVLEQFGTVVSWFQQNWPLILETNATVMEGIKSAWGGEGGGLSNVVRVAWEAVKTIISTELAVILDIVKMQMQLINGDWQGAWQTFLSIVQTTTKGTEDLLYLFFGGTIEALKTWATGMLEGVKLWGEGQATAVTESLAALLAVFTEGWAGIQAYITETTTAIQTAVMAVWNQIPEDIRADLVLITSHLTEQGAAWLASVQTTVDAIWTAITTKLAEIAAAVMTWASTTIMEPLNNLTNTATQAAEETGTGIWAAITTKLAETVTALRTWADSTFMEPLRRLVSTAGSAAREIGTAIVNGIISGVRSMGDALSGVLASMVRSALQAAKAALDIKSPSKVFSEQVGQPIVQGIMQGLESMSRPLDGALSGLVSAPTLSPSYAMAGGGSMGVGRQDVMVLDFRVDGRTAEKIYVMGRDITISRGQGRR